MVKQKGPPSPRNVTSALFSHRAYARCAGVAASKQEAAAVPLLPAEAASQIPDDRLTARRQDDASVAPSGIARSAFDSRRFDGMAPDLARALLPISLRRGLQ
jgi:hypothetical protein